MISIQFGFSYCARYQERSAIIVFDCHQIRMLGTSLRRWLLVSMQMSGGHILGNSDEDEIE